MTALPDWNTCPRVLELGARDFITLPYERSNALARILTLLGCGFAARNGKRDQMNLDTRQLLWWLGASRRRGRPKESHDNKTLMHVLRVGKGFQCLARAEGLGEETANLILHAAPP